MNGHPEFVAGLELFEEFAGRAGDVDSAGDAALAVLDALDDTSGFGALGTVGALLCIHDLFAVAGLGNLCHCDDLLGANVLAWPAVDARGDLA